MSQLTVVLVTLWMTNSAVQSNTVDSLLTSANSWLTKLIKVPHAPSKSKVSHLSATNAAATGYRFEIPVYEPITAADSAWATAMKASAPHAAMGHTSPAISGYRYWTYGKVPQPPPAQYAPLPPLLDFHYQSPAWTAALYGHYMHEHYPSGLMDSVPQHQPWSPPLREAPSYQYPLFLSAPTDAAPLPMVPAMSKSPEPNTAAAATTGLYLIGKTKNYFIPPVTEKVKPGQLPMSLVALTHAEPQEMLAMSEDRRYEMPHAEPEQDKFQKHYFNDQKAFYHQQVDHYDSSLDPFSETRTFEHFRKMSNPAIGDQNHFFSGSPPPQVPSFFDQYPYLDDTFNNFASLVERTPQKVYSAASEAGGTNPNWPHQSKYEPVNMARNDSAPSAAFTTRKIFTPNKVDDSNCTTKRPELPKPFKYPAENDEPFRPMLPGMGHDGAYFESLRKRSGLLDSNHARHGLEGPHQQQFHDRLIAANSVNRQTKVKMNNVDEKYSENVEGEDTGSEYDKSKAGEDESTMDAEKEYSTKSQSDDSGDSADGGDAGHDKERMQYLKDKGYAKHGWKNVYHKEEWGEQKKYHDIWRFKDWKDRFAEKAVSASHLQPVIVSPSANATTALDLTQP